MCGVKFCIAKINRNSVSTHFCTKSRFVAKFRIRYTLKKHSSLANIAHSQSSNILILPSVYIITHLSADLVTALAGLNVNDLPHDECVVLFFCLK